MRSFDLARELGECIREGLPREACSADDKDRGGEGLDVGVGDRADEFVGVEGECFAQRFDPCGLFIHHDDQGPIIELGQLDETADEWVTRAALRALPAHVAQPLESAGA